MTHPSPSPQPLRRSAGQACAGVHREHVRHYGWAWLTALLLILASALALPASAQTFPKFTGLVVDDANVLPPQVEADLTAKLEALQKDTKRQLVVATIGDLQGYPKEEYGYKLGRAWGVGMRDVNNGAILFIAPNAPAGRRGVRVEVGRGLEPVITDALSSVVINNDMLPKLRADDISGAMTAGADALIQQLRASPEEAQARLDAATRTFDQAHRRGESNGGGLALGAVIPLFVIGFIVLAMVRRGGGGGRRYRSQSDSGLGHVILWGIANEIASGALRGGGGGGSDGVRGWGGDSSGGSDGSWGGGGFTGGGGGDFGGGGASGDW